MSSNNSNNDDFDDLEIEEDLDIEYEQIDSSQRQKKQLSGKIALFFRSTIGPGDKVEKLTVDVDISIADLKETVGALFGISSEDYNIVVSGRTADDDDILSNYDIEPNMELLIIPISQAG